MFPTDLVKALDQADSADYSEEDILAPTDWTLINCVTDPPDWSIPLRSF